MNLLKNKYYLEALEFIAAGKLEGLEPGKHVIDGENLYVNVVEIELKKLEDARLEVHDKYIDIQIPLSGAESYGVMPRSACGKVSIPYNPDKDVMFFEGVATELVSAQPGGILVFTPDIAHAPGVGEGKLRKAIFKVKVSAE